MTERRGQTGLDRLLVFIVGITVMLVLVPVALGVAGIDIRDGEVGDDIGSGDDEVDDGSLTVLSSYGTEITDDRTTVGVVEMLVTPAEESVDLADVTVTWEGADRFELTPTHIGAGDASFGIESLSEESVLQPGDRAFLRFDLGSDDLGDVQRFGDRLEPGDRVTVTITTGEGAESSETMTVPEPLPPGTAVRFV